MGVAQADSSSKTIAAAGMPCPFCESVNVELVSNVDDLPFPASREWFICCQQCEARGPAAYVDDQNPRDAAVIEAIRAWNERPFISKAPRDL